MRSAWLILGSFALLIDCGGTAFQSGASGGSAQAGSSQAGTHPPGGSDQGGNAQGGNAGVVTGGTGGDLPNGGLAGSASAGGPPIAGTGGVNQAGAGGASMGGAGMGGASMGGSAGMPTIATSCPPSPPNVGDKCQEALECWYGDDRRVACKSRYQCASGQWASSGPSVMCAAIPDCSTTPSGFPVVGHSCKTQGEECTFDGGASGTIYCRCNFCGGGNCPSGMLDWACAGPPLTPCPENVPNQGQPCDVKSSAMCSYGVSCAGETMSCKANVWTEVAGGCAN